jgi:adenylate cyclase
LLGKGTEYKTMASLVRAYTRRLEEDDILVDRVFFGTLVPHPQTSGIAVIYERAGDEVRQLEISHADFEQMQANFQSPIRHLLEVGTTLRARLGEGEDQGMADLTQLMEDGYVDYLGLPIRVAGKLQAGIGFATLRPGGFSDADVATLESANEAMGPVAQLLIQSGVQATLLKAYLGTDAGTRVHEGQVRRGQGQTLPAAIWISDLRGFTPLSEQHPLNDVLGLLNDTFEVLVTDILAEGGQVLKFMGDGLLAVFSAESPELACRSALRAARAAQENLGAMHEVREAESLPVSGVGIGLHYGDVMYGNIGAPGRLDFTVIGPAVNLAARIESLCGSLGRSILMSEGFAGHIEEPLESCAEHRVKGVEHPVQIFGCG